MIRTVTPSRFEHDANDRLASWEHYFVNTTTQFSVAGVRAALLAVILIACTMFAGCNESQPESISSATSGYRVEDGSESDRAPDEQAVSENTAPNTASGSAPSAPSEAGRPNDSNSSNEATLDAIESSGQGSTNGSSTSPILAALQLPKDADFKRHVQLLARCDDALRDAVVRYQQRLMPDSEFQGLSQDISNQKLLIATSLENIAEDQSAKDLAFLGQLQALSQLVGSSTPGAASQLEALAKNISQVESPAVVHQANIVLCGLEISDFALGRSANTTQLLVSLEDMLSSKEQLELPAFQMTMQAMNMLAQKDESEAIEKCKTLLVAAFSDHPDAKLSMGVWRMQIEGSRSYEQLADTMDSIFQSPNPDPPTKLKEAAEALLTEFPGEKTIIGMADQLVQIEYAGFSEHAMALRDFISENLSLLQPAARTEINTMLDSLNTRLGLLGSPLDLSNLVGLDGSELELDQLKGKVVLVDVWATWCGPCIREFPSMQRVYEAHRERGFEIVGINIDQFENEVTNFQKQRGLPWIIVRGKEKADQQFDSPIAQRFGVKAIPFMLLADRSGIIRQLHPRGDKLMTSVMELLDENPEPADTSEPPTAATP